MSEQASSAGNEPETQDREAPAVLAPLRGFTVGVTADRRADEQAVLLARRGARVVRGPSIRTLPLAEEPEVVEATEAVIGRPPSVVVLLTALGCRAWLSAAESLGLDRELRQALGSARVMARGPKAAGAAVAAGLEVDWQAASETAAEVRDALLAEGVTGRRVVVQRDGAATADLADALAAAGADVIDVPVYRWTLPLDPQPALRLVEAACDRRLDAITFTSSPAVTNLVDLARQAGRGDDLLDALAGPVLAACVGPVCSATAIAHGITRIVQPGRARLGALVQSVVRGFESRTTTFRSGDVDVVLQGEVALVGGEVVVLSRRERDVLVALAARPGRVLAKADLLETLWGGGDPHLVEVGRSADPERAHRRAGAGPHPDDVRLADEVEPSLHQRGADRRHRIAGHVPEDDVLVPAEHQVPVTRPGVRWGRTPDVHPPGGRRARAAASDTSGSTSTGDGAGVVRVRRRAASKRCSHAARNPASPMASTTNFIRPLAGCSRSPWVQNTSMSASAAAMTSSRGRNGVSRMASRGALPRLPPAQSS